MDMCERCRKAEEAIGRAEVRAAQAEADLGRERKIWSFWLVTTLLLAGYAAYLNHAYDLKVWVWYDLIVPARKARQEATQQPAGALQQQLLPPTQSAPRQPQDGRQSPPQRRRQGQR
jgi:hypothetical protein